MKKEVPQILSVLKKEYGKVRTDLTYTTDWQLLFAVILSAQNTDKNVNKITPVLFAKYKTLEDFANASLDEIEKMIYSAGYYKSKAKYIKGSAELLLKDFCGIVPSTIEDLLKLPGVGRKTANVILGVLFNKPDGVVVDTHVIRISYRLGLSKSRSNVLQVERQLNKIIPKSEWENYSLYLINHGRKYCIAKNPKCSECPLGDYCQRRGVLKSR